MATSLVTEYLPYHQTSDVGETAAAEEQVIDEMFDHDQDFTGLGVDFDFCPDLQLDGVDFPLDIWNTESGPTHDNLGLSQKPEEESFNIDEEFHQMLNEWDSQMDSIQTSEMDDIVPSKLQRTEETAVEPESNQQTAVSVRKPVSTNTYRGMITSNQTRQIPLSSTLRAPIVTRGVCYTRTGGIGVSRSVHSSGMVASSPRLSLSNHYSVSSRQQGGEEPPFLFTPVSPIRSPNSSNAPDFFVASTRSTADVVKSNYSHLINQCRNSIITTNPDSVNKYSEMKNSPVKIIAAVSPKSDGTSTAKILSSHSIRESLPKELIDKIRAASQGRKTIAIIEPINRKESSADTEPYAYRGGGRQTSRFAAAETLGKWRNVGIIPPFSNNVSDHDYCSPGRASRFTRKYLNAQHKVMRQIEESMNKSRMLSRVTSPVEEPEVKKDSGLESCEMSDASEDGTLYDKLPRYLTNASVQTVESRSIQEDHGYNRIPAYLIKPQQSLLKANVSKGLDKHTVLLSPVEYSDQQQQDSCDYTPDPSPVDQAAAIAGGKVENATNLNIYDRSENFISEQRLMSRISEVESKIETQHGEKPLLKRRRQSVDSSSDETDSSYRRSYKRRRSNHLRETRVRPSSREMKRRYLGRSRSCSSSTERSYSRSGWSSRPSSREQERSRRLLDRRDRGHERKYPQHEHKAQVEDRKIVYVGKIEEGTLKSDLRARFETFGPIVDISVHFRDHGDNYGFLTFQNQGDAYAAIEHGNDDLRLPKYDLCFGGRRTFCREDYYDLDDVELDNAGGGAAGFDELLRRVSKEIRK